MQAAPGGARPRSAGRLAVSASASAARRRRAALRGSRASPAPPARGGRRRGQRRSPGARGGAGERARMTMSSRTTDSASSGIRRDADARRHEALDGLVVVALEGHLRLEAGGVAAAHDVARARARARGLHPRFAGELLRGASRRAWRASGCSRGSARCIGSSSSSTRVIVRAREASARRTRTAAPGRARRRAGAATISSGSPSASVSSTSG